MPPHPHASAQSSPTTSRTNSATTAARPSPSPREPWRPPTVLDLRYSRTKRPDMARPRRAGCDLRSLEPKKVVGTLRRAVRRIGNHTTTAMLGCVSHRCTSPGNAGFRKLRPSSSLWSRSDTRLPARRNQCRASPGRRTTHMRAITIFESLLITIIEGWMSRDTRGKYRWPLLCTVVG